MQVLHVAALPYPSPQGTQAAIRSMVEASESLGRSVGLLTYGSGDGSAPARLWDAGNGRRGHDRPLRLRASRMPGRPSLRSGPSIRKLIEDVALARALGKTGSAKPFDAVIAHHVEAAAVTWIAANRPWLFFAHTGLREELPAYGPRSAASILQYAGARVDHILAAGADAVATLSPALCARLEATTGLRAHYVPLPWPIAESAGPAERRAARAALGLTDAKVVLYIGNLDAYQGCENVLAAVSLLHGSDRAIRLLICTASPTGELRRRARDLALGEALMVQPLEGERSRRQMHAAADVVIVPRRHPGGVPVKLLDAMARGRPTVVTRRAASGLAIDDATHTVSDDDADALARGIAAVLESPPLAASLVRAGQAYLRKEHSAARYQLALEIALDAALRARARQGPARQGPARRVPSAGDAPVEVAVDSAAGRDGTGSTKATDPGDAAESAPDQGDATL